MKKFILFLTYKQGACPKFQAEARFQPITILAQISLFVNNFSKYLQNFFFCNFSPKNEKLTQVSLYYIFPFPL